MIILCGLGNPGPEYSLNRHNIGFMFIDFLAEHLSRKFNTSVSFKNKWQAEIATINAFSTDILFIKPLTYMNLSGKSVQQAAQFYKVPLDNIFVVHDDIDLPFAKVKAKLGGGDGGHNGLKSITQLMGNNYYRLRLGVGRDSRDVAKFVLSNFKEPELDEIGIIFNKIADNFKTLLSKDLNKFTTNLSL